MVYTQLGKLFLFLIFIVPVISFSQFSTSNEIVHFAEDSSDVAKVFLSLEKEFNPNLNIEKYLYKIDSLAQLIQCEFENCETIQDTISVVNQFFFQPNLIFQEDCQFISNIFDKQCGNCASFSALYLATLSRLEIKNMYAVLAPKHIFIRYDNGNTKINIETTQKGKSYSDKWYLNYFNVSEKFLQSNIYFRNLSSIEFVSVLINNRGDEFLKNGERKKALKDFNTALSVFPTLPEVYFGLAHYYDNSGDKKKAIKQYDKILQYSPEYVYAYCNRGFLYEQTGKFDIAINDYNTAIKFNPNFAEVYYSRGSAYTRKGNYTQAIIDFTTAIEIKSDYADAYYNRGCARNLSKDYIGAIQDYTRTIELGQITANTYIYRGDCRNATGDKKGACEDWKIGFEMGYKSDNKKGILKYCKE